MKYNVFFIWFGFCIRHFCLSPCKQFWEVKIPIFWGERINLNCMWFQFWVLVMLSCLTSRRSGSIIYSFNASTKNNINPTIIMNMKLICKLGVQQEQQCKNQEQHLLSTFSYLVRPPGHSSSDSTRSTLDSINSTFLDKPQHFYLPPQYFVLFFFV